MFCPYKRSPCHSGLVKILLPLVALTTNHVLLLIRHSLLISFKHCLTSSQFTKHFYIAYLILLMSRGKCPHPHFIYKTPEAQNDQVTCPGIHLSSKLWIISLCLPHKYHSGLNPGSLNQSSLFFLSIIKPSWFSHQSDRKQLWWRGDQEEGIDSLTILKWYACWSMPSLVPSALANTGARNIFPNRNLRKLILRKLTEFFMVSFFFSFC